MPTIEKKPLPPIGSGSVAINPSDKEDITGRARDVIDHYVSGKGSWWDEGPRKSAQQTIEDLNRFKDSVLASEQYVDDPGSVLSSVKKMIDEAVQQVSNAMPSLDADGHSEIRPHDPNDSIMRARPPIFAPPATNGRIPILATPRNQGVLSTTSANRPLLVSRVEKAPDRADPNIRVLRRIVPD
ncbi:hypothetical protein JQ621_01920 [Bradyrhizobium manausense]|uniref:hypothetical protein n=1 Tax=Bradyrhizobium manausense TaxID=989370 RepID=UPI001BA82161|nr:hypothetical protein [Bradyrhizobium manausense]MBR1086227.1 hypothetical protein [Bradyrhizobium manausense]